MSQRRLFNSLIALALLMAMAIPVCAEDGRKLKDSVPPAYPEMAKNMHLAGKVRIQITVLPNGGVKDAKVLGGHPLLADAAMRAVQRWKYEPGAEETLVVEVVFKGAGE